MKNYKFIIGGVLLLTCILGLSLCSYGKNVRVAQTRNQGIGNEVDIESVELPLQEIMPY